MYDMIVVGGGPAGMTAALYALRNGKSALVIEKAGFGGQITHSPKVENYPGTLQMSGNEFADRFLEQILAQGAEVELENVVSVRDEGGVKIVETEEGGRYEALTVVLATGVKHRMLGLPGENELVGEGISFCAVCDGDFYAGQTVCVAGGGNSALQEAILLAEKCKEVIILQDLPTLTGEQRLQDVLLSRPNVRAITNLKINALVTEGGALKGVAVEDRITGAQQTVACDGLFVAIGLIPENEPFAALAKLNKWGYFDTDEQCTTETPGVYVAGDCRSKFVRQLTTAVADGATAALAACRYINERK
ncbi:MAG: FAD-dependent oxidoreductase [Clostridia bacterium]|nr:FAD-dependent oxidoreductase [Clostridia bacterium]MBQ9189793.1 FAD-dependent oxidoreductase [Clostridia bacterium]